MFLDLVRQELGASKSTATHDRFCCPFCDDSKYKFYVHKESGLWCCFKCDEGGNPAQFVMKHYEESYAEAIDTLMVYDYDVKAQQNGYSFSKFDPNLTEEEKLLLFISSGGKAPEEDEAKVTYTFPAVPTNCKTLAANFNNPEAYPFFAYLHGRGVTLEQIHQHNISYVINGTVDLISVDGTPRQLNLRNHVVFYTFDENRKPLYWNTRSIEKNAFIKSFNAPSKPTEYSKNNTIFNLNNVKYADKIVVHEGVFNSFMTPGCGVATFGKQVTDEQIRVLLEKTQEKKQPIYLYLDTDAWEQMIKAANKIHAAEPNRLVYYVFSGTDEDANDLGMEKVQELIDNAFLADAEGELKLLLLNS